MSEFLNPHKKEQDEQIELLLAQWVEAKAAEERAKLKRRDAEDQLNKLIDTSKTQEIGRYKVNVSVRINQSINADLLQEIAKEHGLSDMLSTLFRWKPEVNANEWKKADAKITAPLSRAITATPGRPSFTITKEKK